MLFGRVRPPAVARASLCAVGGLAVSLADQVAVRAAFGPFDLRFWLKVTALAIVLYAVFMVGERLLWHRSRPAVGWPASCGGMSGGVRAPRFLRNGHGGSVFTAVHAFAVRFRAAASRSADRFEALPMPVRLAAVTAAVLACWTPVIVLMAPGAVWYDTGDQIAQFFSVMRSGGTAGSVSSHHPVFDTLVLGGFAWAGRSLGGDWMAGLVAYLVIQVAATAMGLAGVCLYVRHVGLGRAGMMAMLLFFAVFPAFPIFTMSIVKDTLHMVFLIPWLLMVAQVTRTRLAALRSWRFAIGFVAVSALCALTTMTGLYIVALTLCCLCALPIARGGQAGRPGLGARGGAVACAAAVILIAGVAFPAAVRGPLHVRAEDSNQLLVVPMQMTARFALDHPDDATPYERRVIDRVNRVPFERMAERYNPYLADPVIQYSLRDPSAVPEYLGVWLAMGLRHPDSYAAAFASLESGWFSLARTPLDVTDRGVSLGELERHAGGASLNTMWFQINDAISPEFRTLAEESSKTRVDRTAAYALWDAWRSTPVVRVLTLTAVWTFLLPLFLVFCRLGFASRSHDGDMGVTGGGPGEDCKDSAMTPVRLAWFPFAIPLVWSLLSLLPNAISIPLKPTATRYMLWALVMVPLLLALLRCDAARPQRLWAEARGDAARPASDAASAGPAQSSDADATHGTDRTDCTDRTAAATGVRA